MENIKFISYLDSCGKNIDINLIGSKAYNVAKLKENSKNFALVSDGFVLNTLCYENILKADGIDYTMLTNIFDTFIYPFICGYFSKDDSIVIRSSSTIEDSPYFSFSGVYDSFLNISINEPEKILEGIKKVYHSNFKSVSENYKYLQTGKMAILFQKYIPHMEKSGVAFSKNPVTGEEHVLIESSTIDGGVVSGNNSTILKIIDIKNLDNYDINTQIAKLAVHLSKEYEYPVDIEWGLLDNQLYIFQCRSAFISNTFVHKIPYKIKIDDQNTMTGISLSSGYAFGKFKSNKDSIVYLENNYERIFNNLDIINGVISKSSNLLSHQLNILRENLIPVIYSDIVLEEDCFYFIDGFNGKIINWSNLLDSDKAIILKTYFNYLKGNIKVAEKNKISGLSIENKNKIVFIEHLDDIIDATTNIIDSNKLLEDQIITDVDIFINDIAFENGLDCVRLKKESSIAQIQFKRILINEDCIRNEERYLINFENEHFAKLFLKKIGLKISRTWERTSEIMKIDNTIFQFNKKESEILYLSISYKNISDFYSVINKYNLPTPGQLSHKDILEKIQRRF